MPTERDFSYPKLDSHQSSYVYMTLLASLVAGLIPSVFIHTLVGFSIDMSYQVLMGVAVSLLAAGTSMLINPDLFKESFRQIGPSFMGSLPVGLMVAGLVKKASGVALVGAVSGFASMLMVTPTLAFKTTGVWQQRQNKYIAAYRSLFEMRFVSTLLQEYDKLVVSDKLGLAGITGILTAVFYACSQVEMTTLMGQLFVMASVMLLTSFFNREKMQGLRFSINQSSFYGLAFMHGLLHFFWKLANIYQGRSVDDHPEMVTIESVGFPSYYSALIGGLSLGALAGYGDWRATGKKVEALKGPVQPYDASVLARFAKWVRPDPNSYQDLKEDTNSHAAIP